MQQQRLDQNQMMQLLYEHLRRSPQPTIHQPVIIHYQQPPGGPPGAPLAITAGSSQPPPPPGGGGAIAEPTRRLPEPAPEAAPMIPAAAPHFNIGTPPGSLEPAPRRPIRGKQPQPVTPYARPRSRSRVAWKGGMEDPPSLPVTPVLPPSADTGASSSAPGAAKADRDQGPIPPGPPPLPPPAEDPPPLTRGRSPAPRRARSSSGSQPRATRQKRTEAWRLYGIHLSPAR